VGAKKATTAKKKSAWDIMGAHSNKKATKQKPLFAITRANRNKRPKTGGKTRMRR